MDYVTQKNLFAGMAFVSLMNSVMMAILKIMMGVHLIVLLKLITIAILLKPNQFVHDAMK